MHQEKVPEFPSQETIWVPVFVGNEPGASSISLPVFQRQSLLDDTNIVLDAEEFRTALLSNPTVFEHFERLMSLGYIFLIRCKTDVTPKPELQSITLNEYGYLCGTVEAMLYIVKCTGVFPSEMLLPTEI